MQSSLLFTITITWVRLSDGSTLRVEPIVNAPVFPVPFLACAIRFCPVKIKGIATD